MKEDFMLKVRMPKKRKHRGHKVLFDRDFNFRGRIHDDKPETLAMLKRLAVR